MTCKNTIVAVLGDYGITNVAFYEIEDTTLTAIRITDQPYRDHRVVDTIREVLETHTDVRVSSAASNALYDTDDKTGAVIIVPTKLVTG